jgi:hypothetical protein
MDSIIISVIKDGTLYEFEAQFSTSAYSYKFVIQVYDQEIYFEPDEERNLRAVVPAGVELKNQQLDLVNLIGEELKCMLNL